MQQEEEQIDIVVEPLKKEENTEESTKFDGTTADSDKEVRQSFLLKKNNESCQRNKLRKQLKIKSIGRSKIPEFKKPDELNLDEVIIEGSLDKYKPGFSSNFINRYLILYNTSLCIKQEIWSHNQDKLTVFLPLKIFSHCERVIVETQNKKNSVRAF